MEINSDLDFKKNLLPMRILAEAYARFSNELYKPETETATYKAFRDSLSKGQIFSKLELIQALLNLDLKLDHCLFIGHWHGVLPLLMKKMNLINTGTGLELDQFWCDFSNRINHDWPWVSHSASAEDPAYQYLYSGCSTVINTSCEHMSNRWLDFVTAGQIIIAQSNDYQIPEHINTCTSVEEFKNKLNLTKILFQSTQDFSVYQRFTLVGVK